MKPIARSFAVVPLIVAALSNVSPAGSRENVPVATAASDGLPGKIHSEINTYRRSLGKPALQRHAGLDRLARQHAEFMRRHRGKSGAPALTHHGFEERTLMAQRGMGMADLAENVGFCRGASGAAGTLVGAWKRSRGHHLNLKGDWTQTGIGVVVDADGTVFATQLFGMTNRSHFSMSERMRRF